MTATAALVIAIAGFLICPPVGAIVALVLANNARQRRRAARAPRGRSVSRVRLTNHLLRSTDLHE